MKKILVVMFLCMFSIFVAGCTTMNIKSDDATIKGAQYGKTAVYTADTEEQTSTVKGNYGSGGWCDKGADWNVASAGQYGDSTSTWKVVGLETTGTYAGYCHVLFTSQTARGETTMDYWFSEDKKSGYYEMDINGEKYTQVWTAN